MGLAIVIRDQGLDRLRVCSAIGCSRVFVDTSRNRSRRYCDPSTCGNRTNVAAYRARQRSGVAPAR
ncbi:MAG: CGNR zinc finger domain-containing protein, partial [Acidimicrobiia bacterium]